MEQNKTKDSDIIYKSLTKINIDCLSVNQESDISNEEYFKKGIYCDLSSNLLAIFLNNLKGDIDSPGLNINCRIVLESLSILKMYENGELNETNFKLYREMWPYIEYSNESKFFDELEKYGFNLSEFGSKNRKKLLFKWSDILKKNIKYVSKRMRDPSFYLLNNLTSLQMVNKYLGNGFGDNYVFISLLMHPVYLSETIETISNNQIRKVIIKKVFEYALSYLREKNLIIDNDLGTLEDDSKIPITEANLLAIDYQNDILTKFNYKTTHYEKGCDLIFYKLFGTLISIWRDIEVCRAYGLNEQSIIKFKIFAEYMSMLVIIDSQPTNKDCSSLVEGFYLTSMIQICEYLNKHFKGSDLDFDADIVNLYKKYYKDKYPNLSSEAFVKGIKTNSLFFINNCTDEKSYHFLINETAKKYYKNDLNEGEHFKDLYKISLDAGHSCGYLFTSSEYVWRLSSRDIDFSIYCFYKAYFDRVKHKYTTKPFAGCIFPQDLYDKFEELFQAAREDFDNPKDGVIINKELKN